jgi:hypothetical protein
MPSPQLAPHSILSASTSGAVSGLRRARPGCGKGDALFCGVVIVLRPASRMRLSNVLTAVKLPDSKETYTPGRAKGGMGSARGSRDLAMPAE